MRQVAGKADRPKHHLLMMLSCSVRQAFCCRCVVVSVQPRHKGIPQSIGLTSAGLKHAVAVITWCLPFHGAGTGRQRLPEKGLHERSAHGLLFRNASVWLKHRAAGSAIHTCVRVPSCSSVLRSACDLCTASPQPASAPASLQQHSSHSTFVMTRCLSRPPKRAQPCHLTHVLPRLGTLSISQALLCMVRSGKASGEQQTEHRT